MFTDRADAQVAKWDHVGRATAIGNVCKCCRNYWPCVTWRLADAVLSGQSVTRGIQPDRSRRIGPDFNTPLSPDKEG